jgi:hypothetical protein
MSPPVLDEERLFSLLMTIILLSFLLERALAILFENRWFVERFASRGVKEPITVAVAFTICKIWNFDALSILFSRDASLFSGQLITAAIIAGGSKASIKLFHDVFHTMSTAEQERQERAKAQAVAAVPQAIAVQPSVLPATSAPPSVPRPVVGNP